MLRAIKYLKGQSSDKLVSEFQLLKKCYLGQHFARLKLLTPISNTLGKPNLMSPELLNRR